MYADTSAFEVCASIAVDVACQVECRGVRHRLGRAAAVDAEADVHAQCTGAEEEDHRQRR